jgi:hypothetical protein
MTEELPETPVDETEVGSDDLLNAHGAMQAVQEQRDKDAHDEANEEAIVSNTEPEDDGLPAAE